MKHFTNRLTGFLALLFLTVSLAGCTSLLDTSRDQTPDKIYDLVPSQLSQPGDREDGTPLFIGDISYPEFINTERIPIKDAPEEILYLKNSRWSDQAPDLIRRYLSISLDTQTSFMVLARDHAALNHDYRLDVDVRDFAAYTNGGGTPEVRIEIVASLVQTAPLEVIERKTVTRRIAAGADSTAAIVSAYNDAMAGVADDLAAWLSGALE